MSARDAARVILIGRVVDARSLLVACGPVTSPRTVAVRASRALRRGVRRGALIGVEGRLVDDRIVADRITVLA